MCCFCLWKKGVFEYLPYLIIHPGKNLFHCQQHSLTTCPLSTTTLSTTVYHCLPLLFFFILISHIPYPISHIHFLPTSSLAFHHPLSPLPSCHILYYTILFLFFLIPSFFFSPLSFSFPPLATAPLSLPISFSILILFHSYSSFLSTALHSQRHLLSVPNLYHTFTTSI